MQVIEDKTKNEIMNRENSENDDGWIKNCRNGSKRVVLYYKCHVQNAQFKREF